MTASWVTEHELGERACRGTVFPDARVGPEEDERTRSGGAGSLRPERERRGRSRWRSTLMASAWLMTTSRRVPSPCGGDARPRPCSRRVSGDAGPSCRRPSPACRPGSTVPVDSSSACFRPPRPPSWLLFALLADRLVGLVAAASAAFSNSWWWTAVFLGAVDAPRSASVMSQSGRAEPPCSVRRTRAPASSITSMALSGRKRSVDVARPRALTACSRASSGVVSTRWCDSYLSFEALEDLDRLVGRRRLDS